MSAAVLRYSKSESMNQLCHAYSKCVGFYRHPFNAFSLISYTKGARGLEMECVQANHLATPTQL